MNEDLKAGKVTKVEKLSPVKIQRVRPVGIPDAQGKPVMFQLQVQQDVMPTTGNPLLSLTMQGDPRFSSNRSRVAWQNFSKQQLIALNLPGIDVENMPIEGHTFDPENKNLPVLEIKKIDQTNFPICLVEIDSLTPRDMGLDDKGAMRKQAPKTAGKDGEQLTWNGNPIYRNIALSMEGIPDVNMGVTAEGVQVIRKWDEDFIITHNNVIEGSIRRAAQAAIAGSTDGVGTIKLPGGAIKEVTAEGIGAPGTSATGTPNDHAYGIGAGHGKENQPETTSQPAMVVNEKKDGEEVLTDPPGAGSKEEQKNKTKTQRAAENAAQK